MTLSTSLLSKLGLDLPGFELVTNPDSLAPKASTIALSEGVMDCERGKICQFVSMQSALPTDSPRASFNSY